MAVAHRMYARALFEAARDEGRLDPVREELGDFVEAQRQVPELRALLRNPQLAHRAKAAASTGSATNSRQGGGEAACPRSGPVEGETDAERVGGFPGKFRKESVETQTRRDHLDPQAADRAVRRGD